MLVAPKRLPDVNQTGLHDPICKDFDAYSVKVNAKAVAEA